MLYEIKHRLNGSVLFSLDCGSLKLCVEAAIAAEVSLSYTNLSGANLRGANLGSAYLRGANLSSADLSGAYLRGANLRGANLSYTNLSGAYLRSAYLRGANLSGANLSGANLSGANLSGANLGSANLSSAYLRSADLSGAYLRGANLRGANLSGANLSGADLSGAYLRSIRDDIWAVLSSAPAEAKAVRSALLTGKIDGSCYEGDCCCLVGTLGKARGCEYDAIPGLTPDSSRLAEVWFFGIKTGDTPETNPLCKIAYEWVDEWIKNMESAFGGVNHGVENAGLQERQNRLARRRGTNP